MRKKILNEQATIPVNGYLICYESIFCNDDWTKLNRQLLFCVRPVYVRASHTDGSVCVCVLREYLKRIKFYCCFYLQNE